MSIDSIFWSLMAFSLVLVVGIYHQEKWRYGGMGLASPSAVTVIIYCLVNPAVYVINPLLAIKYAEYVGLDQTPETLLPAVLCTVLFLLSFMVGLAFRRRYRLPDSNAKLLPLPPEAVHQLLRLGFGLMALAFFMFLVRNMIAYGSPFASVSQDYSGASARPQVTFWSSCGLFMLVGLFTLSVLAWWQTSTRRWPVWACILPAVTAILYAIAEGDRIPAGTIVLFALGWVGYRARIGLHHIIYALLLVTFLTLLANARYHKGEHGFVERLSDITNPEYFRPFWSSDPSGPSTVMTMESIRVANGEEVSWGVDYVTSFLGIIPRVFWPDRPDDPTTRFSKWYANYWGLEYNAGEGYAYSMIAESFVNFWYFGPVLLGLIMSVITDRLSLWCMNQPGGLPRAVFACAMTIIPFQVPRAFFASMISPSAMIIYGFMWYTLRICATSLRRPEDARPGGVPVTPLPSS
jgi:oligosaccharide repeat unit polymerase